MTTPKGRHVSTSNGGGSKLRALRAVVDRTQPNRAATGYFRHPEAAEKESRPFGGARTGAPMSSPEDMAVYAVRLGYKVAEEQLRKSKVAARRLRRSSIATGSGDVGDMIAYSLRIYREISELVVEATETLGASSRIFPYLLGKYRAQAKKRPTSGSVDSITDALAKLTEAITSDDSKSGEKHVLREETKANLNRIAQLLGPALSTLRGTPDAPKAMHSSVLISSPPGVLACGELTVHATDADVLECDALVGKNDNGKSNLLESDSIRFERTRTGAWQVSVVIKKGAKRTGKFRGVVSSGKGPAGYLEVTLTPIPRETTT